MIVATVTDPAVLAFTIPLAPRGKGSVRTGKGRTFTDSASRSWMATVAQFAAAAHRGRPPMEGPLELGVVAVMPRPKRLMRKSDPDGLVWCPSKPACANIVKAVCDGMRSVWRDDAQLSRLGVEKFYAEKTGTPRVEVACRPLREESIR